MSPTSLEQLVRDARRNNDYSPLVELIERHPTDLPLDRAVALLAALNQITG